MNWQAVVEQVVRESRTRMSFLPRDEIRGLERQAGDDYRAAADMVESMEGVAQRARDRALEVLAGVNLGALGDGQSPAAVARSALDALAKRSGAYERLGVTHVIVSLDRALAAKGP